MGANSFASGDRLLLLRQDTPEIMRMAAHWRGTLLYLIDDDIPSASEAVGLPSVYRERLGRFASGSYRDLVTRADVLIASSDALAERLSNNRDVRGDVLRLDPFWDLPLADRCHFAGSARRLEMVHLGTASHSGALAATAPSIGRLLDEVPTLSFTYFGRRGTHALLESHQRVTRLTPMRWPAYRRWLTRHRFHLALYPLDDGGFDRARSANKLFEHAIVGAATVYPADWGPAASLGDGAIPAPADPACWYDVMRCAIASPDRLSNFAQAAADALATRHTPLVQRMFWRRHFCSDIA